MTEIPINFIEVIEGKLGKAFPDFLSSLQASPSTSLRRNHKKPLQLPFEIDSPVSWCKEGVFLKERPVFALDPLFHAGAYYVQESSSMFIHFLVKAISSQLPTSVLALDLCAAPGGKTTLLLDVLSESSVVVANEVIKQRSNILKENIIKWGRNNCVVIGMDALEIGKSDIKYDLIVIDAPCSGEGLFRKDKAAIAEWSPANVDMCSARQRRIFHDVFPALNEGGFIIYSTCTFNNKENIDNVSSFINEYDLESIQFEIDVDWGIEEIEKENTFGYHFYPHKVKGEGFFCSVFKRKGTIEENDFKQKSISKLSELDRTTRNIVSDFVKQENIDQFLIHENGDVFAYNRSLFGLIHEMLNQYKVLYSGVKCGNVNKKLFIPDAALALSALTSDRIVQHDMDLEMALQYLRRNLHSIENEQKSWLIATYQGIQMGWLKNLGNRINNYYPQEWRLRMQ